MNIEITPGDGSNAVNIDMKNVTKGQVLALNNALKTYGSPVALQVLEELQDAVAVSNPRFLEGAT